jgi:flagellar motor switch protein FliG
MLCMRSNRFTYFHKSLFFAFLPLLLMGQISMAQSFLYQPKTGQGAEPLNEANNFEIVIRQELTKFFSPSTFLVDINMLQGNVEVIKPVSAPKRKMSLQRLPGMPVLPKGYQENESDSTKNYTYSIEEVEYLYVSIIVDTTYSNTDLDFINSLVRSVIPIDETKGDVVKIRRSIFPKEKDDLFAGGAGANTRPSQEPAFVPQQREQAPVNEEKASTSEPQKADNTLLYVFVILLILCLIIIVFVTYLLYRKGKDPSKKTLAEEDAKLLNGPNNNGQELSVIYPNGSDGGSNYQTEDIINYEFNRQHVITSVISNPKEVAGMIEAWMLTNPEEGRLRAANALSAVNPKLLNFLRPFMTETVYHELNQAVSNHQLKSHNDKYQEARDFSKELLSLNAEPDRNEDLFEFLNQITDSQIIHMLKEEDDNLSAILLAQLESKRSKNVLSMIEINRRSSIIMKMSKIDFISSSIYREVATYFSKKAIEVKGMKNVAFDGLQSILDILDQMQDEDQDQLISSIASQDLDLANNIKQQFVGFKNVVYLTDLQLETALRDIDTNTLVQALTGLSSHVQNKVISQRAPREQSLIKSELESGNAVSPDERDKARKLIIDSIRKTLKLVA